MVDLAADANVGRQTGYSNRPLTASKLPVVLPVTSITLSLVLALAWWGFLGTEMSKLYQLFV
jgi:hypothetical protein